MTVSADAYASDPRARAFVEARLAGTALSAYPGAAPQSLDEAYAIQDLAIEAWPDRIAGWKVGRIPDPWASRLECTRLIGPIFAPSIKSAGASPTIMPVFKGGFAAVEGEFVFVLGRDAPVEKTTWNSSEALDLVGDVVAGIEIASSPYAGINDDGPLVTISDFGNNHGLLLGASVRDWRALDFANWRVVVTLDGVVVGDNSANSIPGGPIESLCFALGCAASRGLPLKAGALISSGAVTGVHQARAGQFARVEFSGATALECTLV